MKRLLLTLLIVFLSQSIYAVAHLYFEMRDGNDFDWTSYYGWGTIGLWPSFDNQANQIKLSEDPECIILDSTYKKCASEYKRLYQFLYDTNNDIPIALYMNQDEGRIDMHINKNLVKSLKRVYDGN